MADEDKDLWTSANDTEAAPAAPETPPEPQATEPTRDERGRFAAKAEETANTQQAPAETAPPQQPEPSRDDHGIPSWRLKEEADAKREALDRAQRYERENEEMRRRLAAIEQQTPKQEIPNIWDNPDGYLDHRIPQAIDPVKSEISQLREFYSQRDAVRTHGAEAVKAAYSALDQAARAGDPEAMAAVSRVKQSMDPYGDMVTWHKKQTIFSTIGDNPDAFFEKTLEERIAKDPNFQAKLLERIRGQAQQRPSTVTPLPPSLNRTAAAVQPVEDDDGGEAGLLRTALRR